MFDVIQDSLLTLRDVKVQIRTDEGVVQAVDGVNLSVARNRTLCIVGESGCGKSMTARAITNLVTSSNKSLSGEVLFTRVNGETLDLAALDPKGPEIRRIRSGEISMIFQEPMTSLSPVHTIGNQIGEAAQLHFGEGKDAARARTIEVLGRVGIPNPSQRVDAYPFQLSGGMRQRAMIAMALVCRPQLLIADEPTTALDVTTQAVILDLMKELQAEMGMGLIFITHDLGVVAEIADDVAVMYLGRVVESGPVDEIFHDPKHPYTRSLLQSIPRLGARGTGQRLKSIEGIVPHPFDRPKGCSFHPRCPSFMPGICDSSDPPATSLASDRQVRCHLYGEDGSERTVAPVVSRSPISSPDTAGPTTGATTPAGGTLIEARNLQMHFPVTSGRRRRRARSVVKAVDGVELEIRQGETLALVGESGCGKSTLGRSLVRIYDPTGGEVLYHESEGAVTDLVPLTHKQMKPYRRDIRMIFQDPHSSLNPRMTVLEIVGECLKLYGVEDGKGMRRRVAELLQTVGLRSEYMSRYPHAFSGGERQRIGIARALALNPRLVVADEAVSALDVSVQAQILNLMKDLQEQMGLTYLFVAHDLSVVEHISDRVAVMYVGKIVEVADTDTLFARPRHPYTEALLSAVPKPDPRLRGSGERVRLSGEVADPANPPSGCYFHPRCPYADGDRCSRETPVLQDVEGGGRVACHHADKLDLAGVALDDQVA
ncbi:ABC transporter ATP-binding protein [Pseudoruegeria sp. HB172150]|uniref:dipeptide ABC transporter ATP-binding protein n=1 Tax=Pseudoruegeria sp. HB172150 TaxID=2721164 RepID=UPI001555B7B4|nr:ABC transporter ATP-binding protein [Pseudoruegeria sp. HB172150]